MSHFTQRGAQPELVATRGGAAVETAVCAVVAANWLEQVVRTVGFDGLAEKLRRK